MSISQVNNYSFGTNSHMVTNNVSGNTSICKFDNECVEKLRNKYNKNADIVSFSGSNPEKDFTVKCSEGLINREISGNIDGKDFYLKHKGQLMKQDKIEGKIGDKSIDLEYKTGFKNKINGTIADKPVNLAVYSGFSGYKIEGTFNGEKVNINLNDKLNGFELVNDKMNLKMKGLNLISNDLKVKGNYDGDTDLLPVLLDIVYAANEEVNMAVVAAVA